VDREHVARLDDVVAVQQLARGGVPGDVHPRVGLVDDSRPEPHEPVDDAVDRVLVAGDEGGGEDHRVPGSHRDLVVPVRHASEHRHGLALGSGGHEDHLVRRQLLHRAQVHEHAVGHVEVAELRGDPHVPDHGPAHQADLPVVAGGGVEHLLDAVHVGGEGCHHDLPGGLREHRVEHGADVPLVGGEPGDLGVGRVHHEQVHALLTEAREGPEVGDAAVEGELVHLEVAGVEDVAGVGADHDREPVRDRVVDGDELALERPELLDLLLPHREGVGGDAVLLELRLHERERQLGPHDRDVGALAEQVRDGADVVLVPVGEDEGDDVVEPVLDVAEVREDQVHPGMVVLREQHAAVDDQELPVDLEDRHVAPDLTEPAERDDAEGARLQGRGSGQFGMGMAHGTILPRGPVSDIRATAWRRGGRCAARPSAGRAGAGGGRCRSGPARRRPAWRALRPGRCP